MKRKNILLAFIMVFATFFVGTFVAHAVINAPNQLVINHYTKNANDNPLNVPKDLHIKYTSDGKYVYCIDYMLKRSDGQTYNKVSATADKGIAYIVNMGYNDKTETDYFITQSFRNVFLFFTFLLFAHFSPLLGRGVGGEALPYRQRYVYLVAPSVYVYVEASGTFGAVFIGHHDAVHADYSAARLSVHLVGDVELVAQYFAVLQTYFQIEQVVG